MSNIVFELREYSCEFRFRGRTDFDLIVPGCAYDRDPEPRLLGSTEDAEAARVLLDGRETEIDFFDGRAGTFARVTEYVLEEVLYEGGDIVEGRGYETSSMPERITFDTNDYVWNERNREWNPATWYAVVQDNENNDYGSGSYDLDSAKRDARWMREHGWLEAHVVAVDPTDGFALEEIRDIDD